MNFNNSKPHYQILDGLRGLAAIMVVIFHFFEIFSEGDHTKQIVNHGYLAVDFFFLLSGFVVATAYDSSWQNMTMGQFFKRRLIRLQPMLVVGMIIGALCFYFSESTLLFPKIAQTPTWQTFLVMVLGMFMIPVTPGTWEIRGWYEMYPLNGPAWSLFYEYIANILYALVLRKLGLKILSILVVLSGILLANFAIFGKNGDVIGGWALNLDQIYVGFCRLLFPFLMGLLMAKIFKKTTVPMPFLLCSVWLIILLSIPRIGDNTHNWQNGMYDTFTIIFLFPAIIWLAASGSLSTSFSINICKLLGNISYPLYITHFPIMYIFYAWVVNNKISMEAAWPMALALFLAMLLVAFICFKYIDQPIRKWLAKKYS